jgi:hypothetical protein
MVRLQSLTLLCLIRVTKSVIERLEEHADWTGTWKFPASLAIRGFRAGPDF